MGFVRHTRVKPLATASALRNAHGEVIDHEDLATVVQLRPDADSASQVIDGEVVDDVAPWRFLPRRDIARVRSVRTDREGVVRVAARTGGRVAYRVGRGHATWVRRAMDALTYGAIREQIRRARTGGDVEALSAWIVALQGAKQHRRHAIHALPRTIRNILLAATVTVALLAALLVAVGVVVELDSGGWTWGGYWHLLGQVAAVLVMVVTVAVQVVIWCAIPAWLLAAYRAGRGEVPQWLATPAETAEAGATVTPDGIAQALAALKIRELTKYITAGGRLEFLVPPREQGGGTYCQIRLPLGIMAADLLGSNTVERLAGNLSRHKHEVWPQRQPKADARVLDLWVADKGAMDRPAPPWPLLDDGEIDVWRDRIPWGVTMRAEQVAVGMLQKHWLCGATSKQGKTTTIRLLVLGLALDPTVELHIADLKGDGDWSMFADRAATLIEGSADEDAAATCALLEWAVGEMQRRYEVKTEQGITLTREVSRRKGSGFHPIYIVVDECQVLYAAPHPVGGTKDDAKAWRAAKRLHDQARAVNIHLIQATQRPDNRTLPVLVREGAHVRISLNVPNAETAKLILADAADRGARPQDLRPGMDRGVVVATGEVEDIPQGQAFTIVRTHFVDHDQAAAVVRRSVELMRRQGRDVQQRHLVAQPELRDLAADLESVMHGESPVRTEIVRQRLAELHPGTYEGWSAQDLAAALRDLDVLVRKTGGVMVIDAVEVARVRGEGSTV